MPLKGRLVRQRPHTSEATRITQHHAHAIRRVAPDCPHHVRMRWQLHALRPRLHKNLPAHPEMEAHHTTV